MLLLRHVSSLVLPVTVAGIVPALIVGRPGWDAAVAHPAPARWLAGALLAGVGLGLLGWTISLFVRVGQGTLAPWDPTQRLVAVGPYRHVRNPMISGVITLLLGEAVALVSAGVGVWALTVFAINHVYFIGSEEPGLVTRFGAAYLDYQRHVPRWIPRFRPWTG